MVFGEIPEAGLQMTNTPKQVKDISGQRFGRLLVVSFVDTIKQSKGRAARWQCACDCGGQTIVVGSLLRNGNTRSCGCLALETVVARSRRHGMARRGPRSAEYVAWNNMKQRCGNPNSSHYHRYGGRGIIVCDRWLAGEDGKNGFECFLSDMGEKPSAAHSIDRIDRNGNYEPANCRWADQKTQVRNSAKAAEYQTQLGKHSVIETAEKAGLPYGRLRSRRRYGWDADEAITRPKHEPKKLNVNGAEMSVAEATAISPVTAACILKRIRNGWDETAAVITPRQKTGPKPRVQP
jgi:hypothetical protein